MNTYDDYVDLGTLAVWQLERDDFIEFRYEDRLTRMHITSCPEEAADTVLLHGYDLDTGEPVSVVLEPDDEVTQIGVR